MDLRRNKASLKNASTTRPIKTVVYVRLIYTVAMSVNYTHASIAMVGVYISASVENVKIFAQNMGVVLSAVNVECSRQITNTTNTVSTALSIFTRTMRGVTRAAKKSDVKR